MTNLTMKRRHQTYQVSTQRPNSRTLLPPVYPVTAIVFSNFMTFERHPITDAEEGKAVSMENNVKFALNQGSTGENVPLEGEEKPEK